ncbi:preprotein translocase subunit SecA [Desulfosarcina sp. OttesenSCG-928-B08]|nr:preprotein translocase subunit SecA [Desulfosarcina sp. OttesenSCG-928-B08]
MFETGGKNGGRQIHPLACYPEQMEPPDHAGLKIWRKASWHLWHRWRRNGNRLAWIVEKTDAFSGEMARLSDARLRAEREDLKGHLRHLGFTPSLVARSFALIRETASRTVEKRHFPVQLMGGLALLRGCLAEMATGEGKTLTATLPAATAALAGLPVHVITVNDYLVTRDAELMQPLYAALGLSVGCIVQGMDPGARKAAYHCDITYCNNKELVFDYLKDKISLGTAPSSLHLQLERLYRDSPRADRLLHRGLYFALVDEADSVMIDEARTPLIIAGKKSSRLSDALYHETVDFARSLQESVDFTVNHPEKRVALTPAGKSRLAHMAGSKSAFWQIAPNRESLITIALQALHCFHKDRQYLIQEDKIQIVDEFTGRVMPDRNWEGGLHQMIEAKEGCAISGTQETIARITYQRFFRRYLHLSGMTGTGAEVAGEMWSVYGLKTVRIPPNRPCLRKHEPADIHPTSDQRWQAVLHRVRELYEKDNRPVLVGTRSVEASEHLSELLSASGLTHTVLNARQDKEEAEIIAQAGKPGRITIATNMAGRGTDIQLAKGVARAGGLHVILTEHHEARRIDRQLYGRAARQGDPGSCRAITSLEDELVLEYIRNLPVPWAKLHAYCKPGFDRIARLLIYLCQKQAEKRHAAIRRETLKADQKRDETLSFTRLVE